jgi:aminomethyltransferase
MQISPLNALHRKLGARLVPFAGYEMPLQFGAGIRQEHLHTRAAASLFDLSHMGQVEIHGPDAAGALERLVPGDIAGLRCWRQRYTVLTNAQGGIIDDLLVTRTTDGLFVVVNGACREKDLVHLRAGLGSTVAVLPRDDLALLAVQGPLAAAVLGSLAPGIAALQFLEGGNFELAGVECLVHRCGYTGEDGFEISVAAGRACDLAEAILAMPDIQPAGLGARDSLRLEAGLCLYGHDIDENTTPVEAGLGWVIAARRRSGPGADFPGAGRILNQLRDGAPLRRTGLIPDGGLLVREGAVVHAAGGEAIGRVTSGGFGFTAGGAIAMGYVATDQCRPGTVLTTEVRGRTCTMRTCALPFVPHRYHRA